MNRECGECIVCCVYPRIEDPDLQKEAMRHCPNLTLPTPTSEPGGNGARTVFYTGASCQNCMVYAEQPKMCSDYKCAWLLGHGAEEDRPDKSLLLFDGAHGIKNSIEAKPLKDGQEATPEGKATIARMSRSTRLPIIVLNFYERKIQRIEGRGI